MIFLRLGISIAAAIVDLRRGKIPNYLIGMGFAIGAMIQIGVLHVPIWEMLLKMAYPVVALFPVFLIRGIGAGDLKLFSLISFLSEFEPGLYIIAVSLGLAAMVSLYRMLRRAELGLRMWNLKNYTVDTLYTGQIQPYESIGTEGTYIPIGAYTMIACFAVTLWEVLV